MCVCWGGGGGGVDAPDVSLHCQCPLWTARHYGYALYSGMGELNITQTFKQFSEMF